MLKSATSLGFIRNQSDEAVVHPEQDRNLNGKKDWNSRYRHGRKRYSAPAKEELKGILKQFGWSDIIDLGDISGARGMEMILPIWLRTWGATQSGYFGFKIVR